MPVSFYNKVHISVYGAFIVTLYEYVSTTKRGDGLRRRRDGIRTNVLRYGLYNVLVNVVSGVTNRSPPYRVRYGLVPPAVSYRPYAIDICYGLKYMRFYFMPYSKLFQYQA